MLRWVCYLEHLTEQNNNIPSFLVLPLQYQGALMIIPVTLQRLMEVLHYIKWEKTTPMLSNRWKNLLKKTDLETCVLRDMF